MSLSDQQLICTACATQFDETDPSKLSCCRICDDPRQFVPSTGQSFTTLAEARDKGFKNKHEPFTQDSRFHSLWTEPKFGIGQRAILIQTPAGNVLWDLIGFIDEESISWIKSLGGLVGILISHPHYWSTHVEWARAFDCPVYLSGADEEWLCCEDKVGKRNMILNHETEFEIPGRGGQGTGVLAIKLGGHFPGSLVALYDGHLLIADTLVTTPSGLGDWKEKSRPPGMNSFSFLWSIPNMIPLPPDEIASMWKVLGKYQFRSTHGAFTGVDIWADEVKQRVLESMKIQVRGEGYQDHAFLMEE